MLTILCELFFYALLTFILELLITLLFLYPTKYNNVIINCLLINFITNLSINLILCFYRTELFIYILEVFVILIEFLLWSNCYKNKKKILIMCIFANVFSYSVGAFFNSFR